MSAISEINIVPLFGAVAIALMSAAFVLAGITFICGVLWGWISESRNHRGSK